MSDELKKLVIAAAKGERPKQERKTYTQDELEGFLRQAGWREDLIPTMSAVGMAEAELSPDGRAYGDSFNPGFGKGGKRTKEKSYGLWQINMIDPERQKKYDRQRLLTDPVYNAQVALEIYNSGHKSGDPLRHWGAVVDGRYKKFIRSNPTSQQQPDVRSLVIKAAGGNVQQQPQDWQAGIRQAQNTATDPISLKQAEITQLEQQLAGAQSQMERNVIVTKLNNRKKEFAQLQKQFADIPPMPEAAETLAAQTASAFDPNSPRLAVLYTPGKYPIAPEVRARLENMLMVRTPEGFLFISKEKTGLQTPEQANSYIQQNGIGKLIGKVTNAETTAGQVALRSEDADGKELSTSVVRNEQEAEAQAQYDRQQFPQVANQQVLNSEQAVQARQNQLMKFPDKLQFDTLGELQKMDESGRYKNADGDEFLVTRTPEGYTGARVGAHKKMTLESGEVITRSGDQTKIKKKGFLRYNDEKGKEYLVSQDGKQILTNEELPAFLTDKTPGKTKLPDDPQFVKSYKAEIKKRSLNDTEAVRQKFIGAYEDLKSGKVTSPFSEEEEAVMERYRPQMRQAWQASQKRAKTAATVRPETVAKSSDGKTAYEFEKTGRLTVPMGDKSVGSELSFDKSKQENLKPGEYRVTDEKGNNYLFYPETGKILDELSTRQVAKIPLKLPALGSMSSGDALNNLGATVASHLYTNKILDENEIPMKDAAAFFSQSVIDWQTKEQISPMRLFAYDDKGQIKDSDDYFVTERDISQLKEWVALKKDREAALRQTKADLMAKEGFDNHDSEIEALARHGLMSRKDADEEIALYREWKAFQQDVYDKEAFIAERRNDPLGLTGKLTGRKPDRSGYIQKELESDLRDLLSTYGSFRMRQREKDEWAQLPFWSKRKEEAKAVARVPFNLASALSKGVGGTGESVLRYVAGFGALPAALSGKSPEWTPINKTLAYQAGEGWDWAIENSGYILNSLANTGLLGRDLGIGDWNLKPHRAARQSYGVTAADGAGQILGLLGISASTGGVGTVATILSLGFTEQYDKATKANAGEGKAIAAGIIGAIASAPDILLTRGWFKALRPLEKTGFVRNMLRGTYTAIVNKVGEKEALNVVRGGLAAMLDRAAALGIKITDKAGVDELRKLTKSEAALKVGLGIAGESSQELGENKLNAVAEKFLYNDKITWREITSLKDEDLHAVVGGASGGTAGAGVQVATRNLNTYRERKALFELIDESLSPGNYRDGKFSIGEKEFTVKPQEKEAVENWRTAQSRVMLASRKMLALSEKARKTKEFAANEAALVEFKAAQEELSAAVDERADALNKLLDVEGFSIAVADELAKRSGFEVVKRDAETETIPAAAETAPTVAETRLTVGTKGTVKIKGKDETRVVQRVSEDGKTLIVADEQGNKVVTVKANKFKTTEETNEFDEFFKDDEIPQSPAPMDAKADVSAAKVSQPEAKITPTGKKFRYRDEKGQEFSFVPDAEGVLRELRNVWRMRGGKVYTEDADGNGFWTDHPDIVPFIQKLHTVQKEIDAIVKKYGKDFDNWTAEQNREHYNAESKYFNLLDERDNKTTEILSRFSDKPVKSVSTKHDFSSTQVNLTPEMSKKIRQFGMKTIADKDLAKTEWNPREDQPHITVKYGLETNKVKDLRGILAKFAPFKVKLGKTSIFEASGDNNYDVVKIDAESPILREINKAIADALPHKDTHPNYVPHLTLAYVKAGQGKKYAGKTDFEGQEIEFNEIYFSDKNGNQIAIPLGKEDNTANEQTTTIGQQTETGGLQDGRGVRGSSRLLDGSSGQDSVNDAKSGSSTGNTRTDGVPQRVYGVPASGHKLAGRAANQEVTYSQKSDKKPAVKAHVVHYSPKPLTLLDSNFYGTNESRKIGKPGQAGHERTWVDESKDERLKKRIYFYLNSESGVQPKSGLGANAHPVTLNLPLYDWDADPENIVRDNIKPKSVPVAGMPGKITVPGTPADVETAILDAGYAGYIKQGTQSAVVLLGEHKIPLYAGQETKNYPAQELSLEDAPAKVKVAGVEKTFGAFEPAQNAAADYMRDAGLVYEPPTKYTKINKERGKRIADEFEAMQHNPADPQVKAAYDAMIKETLGQWQAIKKTGLKVEFISGKDPYGNPRNAILDVVNNNHLWVFPTDDGFGGSESLDVDISGNPLLAVVPNETISGKPVRVNDIFRIVHDYFGHIKDGNGFRAEGEENAWQSHAAMYSPLARRAMTVETRGQNSWVNFGKYGEFNQTASPEETQYAPQKIGLLPEWVSEEGKEAGKKSGLPVNPGVTNPESRAKMDSETESPLRSVGLRDSRTGKITKKVKPRTYRYDLEAAIDEYDENRMDLDQSKAFVISENAPPVARLLGLPDFDFILPTANLRKILRRKHGAEVDGAILKEVAKNIHRPLMVVKYFPTDENGKRIPDAPTGLNFVLPVAAKNGKPVVVGVFGRKDMEYDRRQLVVNKVSTIHPKQGGGSVQFQAEKWARNGEILYIDESQHATALRVFALNLATTAQTSRAVNSILLTNKDLGKFNSKPLANVGGDIELVEAKMKRIEDDFVQMMREMRGLTEQQARTYIPELRGGNHARLRDVLQSNLVEESARAAIRLVNDHQIATEELEAIKQANMGGLLNRNAARAQEEQRLREKSVQMHNELREELAPFVGSPRVGGILYNIFRGDFSDIESGVEPAIVAKAKEYYEVGRQIERLKSEGLLEQQTSYTPPYTLSVLKDPMLANKQGKKVKIQTLKQILKQPTTKKIEQDIIGDILEQPEFRDGNEVDFDEFEAAVKQALLPLRVIESQSYATYGLESVGLDDGDASTHIYNTTLEHGQTGHFSLDFSKSDGEGWEVREVQNPNTNRPVFMAVRNVRELTEENIAENVGTATSSREKAEEWINMYAQNKGRNKGPFGHTRVVDTKFDADLFKSWEANENGFVVQDSEVDARVATELQSDAFQKHAAEQLVIESYINKYLEGKLAKSSPMFEKTEDLNNVREAIKNAPSDVRRLYGNFKTEMANLNEQITRYGIAVDEAAQIRPVVQQFTDRFNGLKKQRELNFVKQDDGTWVSNFFNPTGEGQKRRYIIQPKDDGTYQPRTQFEDSDSSLPKTTYTSDGKYYSPEAAIDAIRRANDIDFGTPFEAAMKEFAAYKEAVSPATARILGGNYLNAENFQGMMAALVHRGISRNQESEPLSKQFDEVVESAKAFLGARKLDKEELVAKTDTPEYRKFYDDKNLEQKITKQFVAALPIKDKQFIAHRKNYTARLLREEIRRAAIEGREYFLIPTPRTVALIEGYISKEGAMPYEIINGDDRYLSPGDIIEHAGDEYIVVEASGNSIEVAERDGTYEENFDNWKDVEKDHYLSEVRYAFKDKEGEYLTAEEIDEIIQDAAYTKPDVDYADYLEAEDVEDSPARNDVDEKLDQIEAEILAEFQKQFPDRNATMEMVQGSFPRKGDKSKYKRGREFGEQVMPDATEWVRLLNEHETLIKQIPSSEDRYLVEWDKLETVVIDAIDDYLDWGVFIEHIDGYGGRYWTNYDSETVFYTESRRVTTLSFSQPGEYADADSADSEIESFNIEDRSETEQTILKKYVELNEMFRKERPDAKSVVINGAEWLATKLTPEDAGDIALFAFGGNQTREAKSYQERLKQTANKTGLIKDVESVVEMDGDLVISLEAGEILRITTALAFNENLVEAPTPNGMFYTPDQIEKLLVKLDGFLAAANKKGIDTAPLAKFIENIKKAAAKAEGTVNFIVFEDSRFHEKRHQVGFLNAKAYAKSLYNRIADLSGFVETHKEIIQAAYDNFFINYGYQPTEIAAIVEEISTYCATGDGVRKLGLTAPQIARFLDGWYAAYEKQNGEGAVANVKEFDKKFAAAQKAVREEKNERKNKAASERPAEDARNDGDLESGQKSTGSGKTESDGRNSDPSREGKGSGRATGQTADKPLESAVEGQSGEGTADRRERVRQVLPGRVKLRSLPETLREAGLDSADAYYDVFGDTEAVKLAQKKLNRLGLDAAVAYLESMTTATDKTDAAMSFAVQGILRDEAAKNDTGNPKLAAQLRLKANEIALHHAELATKAGQFIQAAAIIAQTRESVVYTAAKTAAKAKKPLTAKETQKFEQMGETAETLNSQISALKGEVSRLKKRIKEIESGETKPVSTGRAPASRAAIARAKEKLGVDVKQLIADIKNRLSKPVASVGGELLAPNGKPSNLNPSLYKMVRTPEFKKWFGSWQENAAVDQLLNLSSSHSRGKMLSRVSSAVSESQILDSIISLIPVKMMNDFGGKQRATEMLLHNPTVFVDILSNAKRNSDIISTFPVAAESIIAVTRTKLAATKPTASNAEMFVALDTLQNNLVFALQRLSKNGFRIISVPSLSRTTTTARTLSSRLSGKSNVTDIADSIHKEYSTTDQTDLQRLANASKVVDGNGEPLVVYHGTDASFDAFEHTRKLQDIAFHFGTIAQAEDASHRNNGKDSDINIIPVFLRATNPLRIADPQDSTHPFYVMNVLLNLAEWNMANFSVLELYKLSRKIKLQSNGYIPMGTEARAMKKIRDFLISKGYDGLVYENQKEGFKHGIFKQDDSYAVLNSNQIKSVFNEGAFDPKNPNILKSVGDDYSDLARLGAALMLEKPLAEISRKDFAAEMVALFGDEIKPDLPMIYAEAFRLREQLLKEARLETAREKLAAKYPEKTEAEIEALIRQTEIDRIEKFEKGNLAKKLANLYKPSVAAQKQKVIERVYEITDDAEVADYAARIVTKDFDTQTLKRQQRDNFLAAQKQIDVATKQLADEKKALTEKAAGSKDDLKGILREEFFLRKKKRENEADIARALESLKDSPTRHALKTAVKLGGEARSIMTSGDLSGVMRQGFYFNVTDTWKMLLGRKGETEAGDLNSGMKALVGSFKSDSYADIMTAIESHPDFELMVQAGIEFADAGTGKGMLTKAEENIRTEYAKKIPVLKSWLELAERTYGGYLDQQRALMAATIFDELRAMGKTFDDNPEEFEAAAYLINIATGRGQYKETKLAQVMQTFGNMFFAPSYMISRFQLVGHLAGGFMFMPPAMRKVATKRVIRFHGVVSLPLLTLGALSLMGIISLVSLDPDDDDFLKFKVTDKARFDILAGMQPVLRVAARLVKDLYKLAAEDDYTWDKFVGETGKMVWRFFYGKFAPLPGFITDAIRQKNFINEPFALMGNKSFFDGQIANRLLPLSLNQLIQATREDGFTGFTLVLPSLLGLGVQYYADTPRPVKSKDILEDFRNGAATREQTEKRLDEAVKKGEMTNRQRADALRRMQKSAEEEKLEAADADEKGVQKMEEIIKKTKPEARRTLLPILNKRIADRYRDGSVKARKEAEALERLRDQYFK